MGEYIERLLQNEMNRLSALYPVLVVTGPRQSGKTTLVRKLFSGYHYVNLENISIREQIRNSPQTFLEQYRNGLVVDEAQNIPELFSYVQVVVDEYPTSKIVLTGSNNFSLMARITQSLAGRAAVLTLLPLSLKEIGSLNEKKTHTLMFNGGYPAVWGRNIPLQDVNKNYYNTYVERDVRQLLNIKDLVRFQAFIRVCAGRVGTEFKASTLSNEVGVSVPTIQEWVSVLEASYIIFRLPPFFRNIGKRLIRSPKLYFYDTGLLCFLLGIENESQLSYHPLKGNIFENLIVLEFYKNQLNHGREPHLYFYRDQSQHEVDLLEERGTGLYAYEIKSADSFTKSFFSQLDYLRKVAGKNVKSTMVIYDGREDTISPDNAIINYRNLSFAN